MLDEEVVVRSTMVSTAVQEKSMTGILDSIIRSVKSNKSHHRQKLKVPGKELGAVRIDDSRLLRAELVLKLPSIILRLHDKKRSLKMVQGKAHGLKKYLDGRS